MPQRRPNREYGEFFSRNSEPWSGFVVFSPSMKSTPWRQTDSGSALSENVHRTDLPQTGQVVCEQPAIHGEVRLPDGENLDGGASWQYVQKPPQSSAGPSAGSQHDAEGIIRTMIIGPHRLSAEAIASSLSVNSRFNVYAASIPS